LLPGVSTVILVDDEPGSEDTAMKWRLDRGQIEVLDDAMVDVLRRKTPAERIEMIAAAHRTARHLIEAGIRQRNPEWDEQQVQAESLRRLNCGAD